MTPLDWVNYLNNIYNVADLLEFTGLLLASGLDLLTGTVLAIQQRRLNSTASFIGMSRKIITIVVVLLAGGLLKSANLEYITLLMITGYFIQEGISLIENLDRLGVPLPSQVTKYFERLADEEQKK